MDFNVMIDLLRDMNLEVLTDLAITTMTNVQLRGPGDVTVENSKVNHQFYGYSSA